MSRLQRAQLFVDHKVQGALVLRVVGYWAYCLLTVTCMLLIWRLMRSSDNFMLQSLGQVWASYAPALVSTLLLLPLVIVDMIRLSNRFTGPLWRMRAAMRQVACGQQPAPLQFRSGDYWHEIAEEFNALLARVSQLESELAEANAQRGRAAGNAPPSAAPADAFRRGN